VSDPASPEVLSRVRGRPVEELAAVENTSREATALPGNDHFVTVDESGTLLGVGVESWAVDAESADGPGGVHLYDVSDPTDPRKRGSIDPPPSPDPTRSGVWTTAHNFELADNHLYSSWYQGGVKVHDVSDPGAPRNCSTGATGSQTKFWTAQQECPVSSSSPAAGSPRRRGRRRRAVRLPGPVALGTGDGGLGGDRLGRRRNRLARRAQALTGAGLGALGFSAWRARRYSAAERCAWPTVRAVRSNQESVDY